MAENFTILVGTVGQGIIRSEDGGENWQRAGINSGLHSDALVRTVVSHPQDPHKVFAGTEKGLYKSGNAGKDWKLVDSVLTNNCVWSLAIDKSDPGTMYAGTGTPDPSSIFRSSDGGETWEERPVEVAKECPAVGVPRVTGIAIDPDNRQDIWVGFEVDGVRRSTNGGDTWEKVATSIPNLDVHNVAVSSGPPKTVVVVVNNDVYTSEDGGEEWKAVGIKNVFPMTYPRGILVKPDDPKTIFLTIGDTTPGSTGAIMRSTDTGNTWSSLPLPVQPNTAMWVVNTQPFDSQLMFAGSRYGYLYRSDDGGDSWGKVWREFSEISSVTWIPE